MINNQKKFTWVFLGGLIFDLIFLDFILSLFYAKETIWLQFFVYVLFDAVTILGFLILYKLYISKMRIIFLLFITILLFPLIIIISQTIFAFFIGIENSMRLLNGLLSSFIVNSIITFFILYKIWLPLSLINFVAFIMFRPRRNN
jgi:hypothetical protein